MRSLDMSDDLTHPPDTYAPFSFVIMNIMNTTGNKSASHNQGIYIVVVAICVIVAAATSAIISFPDLDAAKESAFPHPVDAGQAWLTLIGTSLLVALVEETIFRGILLRALLRILKPRAVILITAAIFAILHAIPVGIDTSQTTDATMVIASLSLKAIQAFAFGILMAAIIFCRAHLWRAIAIHAVFDIIYFAGPVLTTGEFPATYIATSPTAIIALAVSTVILAIPAALAFRFPNDSLSLE